MSQVKEGDIIEVDIELKPKGSATAVNKGEEDQEDSSCSEGVVKRGRVVVLEIGERTKKGGYIVGWLSHETQSLQELFCVQTKTVNIMSVIKIILFSHHFLLILLHRIECVTVMPSNCKYYIHVDSSSSMGAPATNCPNNNFQTYWTEPWHMHSPFCWV